ncbi:YpiF family protein [Paenibacillus oenotherae]|uniref:YpiF family protein n=1 Tax=Paenibacillus oenotherae TaxID=1435645 RepID=A0ABS7D2K3_9BACL|nr:DUF2487 family protein [Paenibacillus oenotherae]MBW7473423.1 YpiF family protein [Paenibacillus oenotherae]
MKFSELTADQWAELQPYLDTAVVPVTGLSGGELPYEATEALERLRDVLDLIEGPFKGRTVTYPACHYGTWNDGGEQHAAALCRKLKQSGFKYVVLAAAFYADATRAEAVHADLMIGLEQDGALPEAAAVSEAVRRLWLGR